MLGRSSKLNIVLHKRIPFAFSLPGDNTLPLGGLDAIYTTTPKRRLYPIVGLFLAVGAPGGLLVMRALVHGELGNWDWAVEEFSSRALTYGYIAGATALLFVGLGAILGSHEDLLRRVSLTDPFDRAPESSPLGPPTA